MKQLWKKPGFLCGLVLIVLSPVLLFGQGRYFVTASRVRFESIAPLETIKAESSDMRGVIDQSSGNFAFKVASQSFKGFNSELQRHHFNENYLESEKYPDITFTGKIIDEIDFRKSGTYTVRAKGILNIKGISRERIIKSEVEIKDQRIIINADFDVLLDDHNIRIPRIVFQKISPDIKIYLHADLSPQSVK